MAGGLSKTLSYVVDPLDLAGGRRSMKKAKGQAAASEVKAAEAQAALKANEDEAAEKQRLAMEEEDKRKAALAAGESRRSAISNYLAKEGSEPSRRRFLVGAN